MSGTLREVVVTGLGMLPSADGAAPAEIIANPKLLRSMHHTFQNAAAAVVLAMRDAGLDNATALGRAGMAPERAGVAAALADLSPLTPDLLAVLAQCTPGQDGAIAWDEFAGLALHQLHPFRRLMLLANMAAAHASLLFGLQGPSFTFTSGASAGGQSVVEAYWTIAEDRADLMVCESADAPEQVYLPEPRQEWGVALVLEAASVAEARGVHIHARLDGAAWPRFEAGTLGEAEPFPSPAPQLAAALEQIAAAAGGRRTLAELFPTAPAVEAVAARIGGA